MKPPRIMYMELKANGLVGPARIGRVRFARNRALLYRDQHFTSLRGAGFKANYVDASTGEESWISGCRRDGRDALYSTDVEIDEDVREEYWVEIRGMPERKGVGRVRGVGKLRR